MLVMVKYIRILIYFFIFLNFLRDFIVYLLSHFLTYI